MRRFNSTKALLAGVLAILGHGGVAAAAHAEDKPSVIRISFPGVGVGGRPYSSGSALANAHLRGTMEEEFKKDGIPIQWTFLRGAGPAVNELFANDLIDFSSLGDLPSVIGRASGLKVKVVSGQSVRGNIYVAVPASSNVQSISELKGKRVAVQKGTATHLAGIKLLEKFGLKEKDVRLMNMDTVTAAAALATGDIDAALGSTDYLRQRDQGVARIVYTTRGGDPAQTSNSSFVASEKFIYRYPELTVRVLKVLVKESKWLADASAVQVFQLWTKSGTTFSSFREDLQGEDFKYRYSPLLDPFHAARYNLQITEAKRLGLTRNTFDYNAWIEPKFLKQALRELNLEDYWQPRGHDGKPDKPDSTRAQAPAPAAVQAAQLQPSQAAAPAGG
ncbi:MAG: transporter substrate-binding protein [Myxococcaceae bacterium]|nr:transporter substrate-binding protein [Myxococcaceae bacterium]